MKEEQELVKKDLQTIEDEILFYKNNIGESVFEIGKRLIEVQSRLEDKTFREWLKEKVNFSRSTAYNFIKVAQEFDLKTVKTFGQSKVFELAKIDKKDRELFLNDTHIINGKEKTVEEMSVRELKKAMKEEFNKDKANKPSKYKEIKSNLDNSFYQKLDYSYEDFLNRERALQEEIERLQREKERIVARKLNEAEHIEDIKVEFEEIIDDDKLNVFKEYSILIYIYRNKEKEFIGKLSWSSLLGTTKEEARENLQQHIKTIPWKFRDKVTTKEWDKIKVDLENYWKNTYWVNVKNRRKAEEEAKQQEQDDFRKMINEALKSKNTPERRELQRELIQTGYKKLALKYHPDQNKNEDATEMFKILTEIKEELLKKCN